MARREIDAFWDRKTRNDLNENFKELYDKDDNIQQQVNDLVLESGGDSNLEVVQARGGHRVLNDRLNSIDSQLAQTEKQLNDKAEKTYVKYEVDKIRSEIGDIITTPADEISAQEIIDARDGEESLGIRIRNVEGKSETGLKNLVINGDFKGGSLDGFHVNFANPSQQEESIILISTQSHDYYGGVIEQVISDEIPSAGKWYVKTRIRALDEGVYAIGAGFKGSTGFAREVKSQPENIEINKYYERSFVFDAESSHNLAGSFRAMAFATYPSGSNHQGKRVEVDNLLAINLSDFFGYGNEPTKEEMDDILATYVGTYFEGDFGAGSLSAINKEKIEEQNNKIDAIRNDYGFPIIENVIDNGNFNNELGGKWRTQTGSTWRIENNTMTIIGTSFSTDVIVRQETPILYSPGKKVYIRANYRVRNNECDGVGFGVYSSEDASTVDFWETSNFTVNEYSSHSAVLTMSGSSYGNAWVQLRTSYPSYSAALNAEVDVQKVLVIDLTSIFGVGNEPTAKQMDEIINAFPDRWFAGVADYLDTQRAIMSYIFNGQKSGSSNKGLKRPLIAVTFDDGFRSDLDLVYPEFIARGIRGTSYIWTDRTDNYENAMNWDELKQMKLNGWGIECHTDTHPSLGTITDEEIHAQLQTVNNKFAENGLPTPRHHALPNGSGANDKRVTDIVMQYRKTCRNIQSNSPGIYNDWDTMDFSAISARSTDGTTDRTEAIVNLRKGDIDLAVENDGILVLITHQVKAEESGQYETPLSRLLEIVDYAREKGMKFVTMEEMYQRVREYRGLA